MLIEYKFKGDVDYKVSNQSCLPFPSEEQSRLAARKYARVVQKLGFPARFLDFKIQNMVGSCDVRFPIRLEALVLTHRQFSRYDGDQSQLCVYSGIAVTLWAAYTGIFQRKKVLTNNHNGEAKGSRC
jgi:hypothetical protein